MFDFEASSPKEPSQFASAVSECLPWRVISSYHFRQTSHINLQELRAFRRELCRIARDFNSKGRVQLFMNDSKVVVGAVAKGRSSSYKINGLLRSMVPFMLFGDVTVALLWVETESNPADHPSRATPLPPPRPPTKWMRSFGIPGVRGWGLEVFAGSARITRAHIDAGCPMHAPVEILMGSDAFSPEVHQLLRGRAVRWIWLALPCCSFSPLRNLDAGGPLRPPGRPEGDESRAEVALGNALSN